MATTAFPATAIFDSGATGRDLIQAADQAAAQAAIGIDPSDYGLLDSDNTWTGDNTFDEPITSPELTNGSNPLVISASETRITDHTVNGIYITPSPAGYNNEILSRFGYLKLKSYSSVDLDYSGSVKLSADSTGVVARDDLSIESGSSLKLFNLGSQGDTDTEFVSMAWAGNDFEILADRTGVGSVQDIDLSGNQVALKHNSGSGISTRISCDSSSVKVWRNFYNGVDGLYSCGLATNRWSSVFSVNADISGTLTTDLINTVGSTLTIRNNGAAALNIGSSSRITAYYHVVPDNTGTKSSGLSNRRWSSSWSVDGSFSNELNVETGGSFKLFNLGDSHTNTTNTEYLEIEGDTSIGYYKIQPKYTGTGRTVQTLRILAVQGSHISLYGGGQFAYTHAGVQHLYCDAGGVSITDLDISGTLKLADGSVTAPSYSFGSQSTMGIYRAATNQINMIAATGGYGFNLSTNSISISSTMAFGWRSAQNISQGHSFDTLLERDATGIIAQRNFFQDAPQAFRIYGTWTDASNGEWLQMDHGVTHANIATISNNDNGTGTGRHLYIKGADQLRLYSGGNLLHWVHTGTQAIYYKDAIRPHGTSYIGTTSNRWAGGYFVDGDFSGTVDVNKLTLSGDTNTYIYNVGGSDWMGFTVAGLTFLGMLGSGTNKEISFNGNNNQDINFKVGYNGGTAIDMDGATGNVLFGADASVASGGSFKLFNLGDSHTNTTNTESMSLYSTSNVNYFYSAATGSGTVRDLRIGTTSNNIWFRSAFGIMAFIANGSPKMEVTGSGVLIVNSSNLFPWTDNASLCGKTDKRWSAVNSYNADFIGTTTLRTFDDGAGNSSSVATQNDYSDSFYLHRTWTGTSGGNSSWIGLKNDYNSTGTAASWIGLSPNTLRLEIANGLRAVWQLSGNQHRLNLNFYPFTDNTWQIGYSGAIWTEVWQGAAKIRGSRVDTSNYGYLSIEPDADDYLIKANSLGTTADAGIKLQTSQTSAAGNKFIVLDADYLGAVSFYFGGNNRGYWSKDTLQPNVQVRTTVAYDINRNWNSASTVYQGYEANITDTASNSESSLLNLKVGGTSYLRLRKDGKLLFEKNGGSAAIVQNAGGISIVGDNGSTVQSFDQYFNYTYKTFRPISDNQHLGYVSRRFLIKANDIFSKGKIRSYNLGDETATDAEYLNLHWLSDHAYLTVEGTGTGTARQFSIGTHTNGSIRFNHGTNIIRFSVGGITASKMYLNSTGLTLYGVLSPQGNLTRDIGTTLAQWRELFVGTVTASGDIDVAGDLNGGDANFTGQVTANEFVGDGSGLTGLPSGSSTLSGLTDTNVSSPANGQLLIYDAVSSKWDNAGLTSSGGTIAITTGAGTINLENAGGAPSDRRLKDNIKSIENCLDKVLKMMPVEFTWKDELKDLHLNTGSDIGFIAQDIEEIEPKLVGERKDYKTLQYEKFAPLIVGAIKELYKQIEDLKN